MSKYIRLFAAPAALCGAFALGACRGDAAKQDTTALKADTALANDLALANRDSAARVQLNDVPATPTNLAPSAARHPDPRRDRPNTPVAPPPAPVVVPEPVITASGNTVTRNPRIGRRGDGQGRGAGNVGTIAAGTTLALAANSAICTNNHAVGDRVTGATTETITGSNGVAIPAGSDVALEVTRLKRSENVNDPIVMEFRVISVQVGARSYALNASVTGADIARVKDEPKGKDVEKVAGGAVVGGLIGQILGKNTRSTVIGAAVGAAAGAGAAVATANYQGCINPGNRISVRLDGPVDIVAGR